VPAVEVVAVRSSSSICCSLSTQLSYRRLEAQ
jgi:hypothetical protein